MKKILCKILGHKFKFDHIQQICDQWFVGSVRRDNCIRCGDVKESTFSSDHPLTKAETEKYTPNLLEIKDRWD